MNPGKWALFGCGILWAIAAFLGHPTQAEYLYRCAASTTNEEIATLRASLEEAEFELHILKRELRERLGLAADADVVSALERIPAIAKARGEGL